MTALNSSELQATTTLLEEVRDLLDTVDENKRIPPPLKELIDTLRAFFVVFSGLQSLLADYSLVYPEDEHVFKHSLQETIDFVQKHTGRRLLRGLTSIIPRRLSQDSVDDQRAADLNKALAIRIRRILEFILISSLQPNLPTRNVSQPLNHDAERSMLRQSLDDYYFPPIPIEELLTLGSSNIKIPHDDDIRRTIKDLIALRNSYDRLTNVSTVTVPKRPSETASSFDSWLEWIWFRMCILGGLTVEGGSVIPLPGNRLLEAPSRNHNESIVNVAGESIHTSGSIQVGQSERPDLHASSSTAMYTPFSQGHEKSRPYSNSFIRSSTTQTTSSSLFSNHHRTTQSSFSLLPPALPLSKPAKALFIDDVGPKRKFPILIRDYISISYHNGGGALKILWRGNDSSVSLEHDLPEDTFPRTRHSKVPNSTLHVAFEQNHRLMLYENGVPSAYSSTREYIFDMPEDLKTFQKIVRGKTLVKTYEVEEIWSDKNPQSSNHFKSGIAMIEDLKIWQDLRYPNHHSISFFASQTTQKHVEYAVDLFEKDLWEESAKNTVRLVFMSRNVDRKPSKKPSSILNKIRKLSHNADSQPNESSILGAEPTAGICSSHIKRPSITPDEDIDPCRPKWILIHFSTRQDYDDFIKTFKTAYDKDHLPADGTEEEPRPFTPPVSPTSLEPPFPPPIPSNFEPEIDPRLEKEDSRQADQWFKDLKKYVHNPLFPKRTDWNEPDGPKRVKVAIIDTGVKLPGGLEYVYTDQLQECRNWLDSDSDHDPNGKPFKWEDGEDLDGHGTHVAGLVLEVAPNAEVFVARVFKTQWELQQQKTDSELTEWRIAQAIRYAVKNWKVDIISMSFGFEEKSEIISEAFDEATSAKPKVLMLAAAANFRNDEVLSWPAKSSRAIGMYNLNGKGHTCDTTPERREDKANFAILGSAVESWWPEDRGAGIRVRKSGTSIATAIAAGVAALIMEIVRQPERIQGMDAAKLEKLKQLGDVDSMTEIFRRMAKKTDKGYNRITPWTLLDDYGEPATIVDEIYRILMR